jgi:hypothetical protein
MLTLAGIFIPGYETSYFVGNLKLRHTNTHPGIGIETLYLPR